MLQAIIALANSLGPFVPLGVVSVEHVLSAIHAVKPDAEVDDDLRALVTEALAAKAEADAAAAGTDAPPTA